MNLFFIILSNIVYAEIRRQRKKPTTASQEFFNRYPVNCGPCQIFGTSPPVEPPPCIKPDASGCCPNPDDCCIKPELDGCCPKPTNPCKRKMGATVYIKYFSPSIVGNKRVLFTHDNTVDISLYKTTQDENEIIDRISDIIPDVTEKINSAINTLIFSKNDEINTLIEGILSDTLEKIDNIILRKDQDILNAVRDIFDTFVNTERMYIQGYWSQLEKEKYDETTEQIDSLFHEMYTKLSLFIIDERNKKFREMEKFIRIVSFDAFNTIKAIFEKLKSEDDNYYAQFLNLNLVNSFMRYSDTEIAKHTKRMTDFISTYISDNILCMYDVINGDYKSLFDGDTTLINEVNFKILETSFMIRSIFKQANEKENIDIINILDSTNVEIAEKLDDLFNGFKSSLMNIENEIYNNEANALSSDVIQSVQSIVESYQRG